MLRGARSLRVGELLSILGDVYKDHETGTLVFQSGPVAKYLYVEEGQIIFAASNAPEDKFTHILVEQGKLSNDQLTMAQEKKGDRTIGKTLVDLGFLASTDLLDALVKQVYRVADSVLHWSEGSATFKPNVLPAGVAKLPISSPRFILDIAQGVRDKSWVGQVFSGMETVLRMSQVERETASALALTQPERQLLGALDGAKSIREICEQSGQDLFSGAKFFLGLSFLGFVHPKDIISPQGQAVSKPVDLSFLDEMLPSPEEPAPVSAPAFQAQAPAPPPAAKEEVVPAPKQAPAQVAAPTPTSVPAQVQKAAPKPAPKAKAQQELFGEKLISEVAPKAPASEARPLFEGFVSRKKSSGVAKKVIYGLAALVIIAGGAVAGWWYFMVRGKEPAPAAPKAVRPAPQAPALPNGVTSPAPAPAISTPAPAPPQTGAVQPEAPKTGPQAAPGPSAPLPAPARTELPAPKQEAQKQGAPKEAAPKPPTEASHANPPSGAPSGGAQRLMDDGRYQEAAAAFDAQAKSERAAYTINIEVACQPETIAKGLQAAGGDRSFFILPYDLHGRSCFVVLWGRYPNRAAAEAALAALPEFFKRDSSPRIVSWASIRK